MKIGAIVPVAGLSSRMGRFKPLLPFNGVTVIESSILSLLNGGIDNICVVTGKNACDIQDVLSDYKVKTIYNENYEKADMLSSIKLGLHMLMDTEAVFILPGDMPYVNSHTIEALVDKSKNKEYNVFYPCYLGKKGHPPLIRNICYDSIMNYNGKGGLRDILSQYHSSTDLLETGDIGCITDIDYIQDYEKLKKFIKG